MAEMPGDYRRATPHRFGGGLFKSPGRLLKFWAISLKVRLSFGLLEGLECGSSSDRKPELSIRRGVRHGRGVGQTVLNYPQP